MRFRIARGGRITQRPTGDDVPAFLNAGCAVVPDDYPLSKLEIQKLNGLPTQVIRVSEALAAMDEDESAQD